MNDSILLHRGRGLATVTLNRPAARNAFDPPMLAALRQTLQELAGDATVRCVLLLAEGSNFSVGGDIREFDRLTKLPAEARDTAFAALLDDAQAISALIRNMPQPVVVAVQGAAAGFGFSLALAADFTVAASDSCFIAGYPALGTSPDGGMSLLLTNAVGYKKAAEILLLGGLLSATQARELTLVHQVVPADLLAASALDLALRLVNGSVNAIRRSKQLLTLAGQETLEKHLATEQQHFMQGIDHDDFREGVAAFIAKRPARFYGEGETA